MDVGYGLWKGAWMLLQKVSTQVSLRSPLKLTWVDTFCSKYFFLYVQAPLFLIESIVRQLIDWLIEWSFKPLSTLFQLYHGDSSHRSCLSRVSLVQGWGCEVPCLTILPRRPQRIQGGSNLGLLYHWATQDFIVRQYKTEWINDIVVTCLVSCWHRRSQTTNVLPFQIWLNDWLIDWMVFYAAFNSISVISRRQLTLFMLSWVSPVLG